MILDKNNQNQKLVNTFPGGSHEKCSFFFLPSICKLLRHAKSGEWADRRVNCPMFWGGIAAQVCLPRLPILFF